MIDSAALDRAFERDGFYALQLEVGDRCLQGCSYCYMNALPAERNTLSDDQVRVILHDAVRLGGWHRQALQRNRVALLERTLFVEIAQFTCGNLVFEFHSEPKRFRCAS